MSENTTKFNALTAFCHAVPRKDGSIDPYQPYMGVVSISIRKGPELEKVNILANTKITLRVVHPGVTYPVSVVTLRNGSLKQFKQSGNMIYKAFKTQGINDKYEDHLGLGFYEYINAEMIQKWLSRISDNETYTVTFTVDVNGKPHRLTYDQLDKELENNASRIDDDNDWGESNEYSAGQELLYNTQL